ncbi:hypothetical protein ACFLW0_02330 [Chloroflexota bacterium]
MSYKNGAEKSSRSKADYFELLVAEKLRLKFGTEPSLQPLIDDIQNEIILKFSDGDKRVSEQENRAHEVFQPLINFLLKEGITKAKKVAWIGRNHQRQHTLSDVDLTLPNDEVVGISLKSVGSGSGTQKNMGYRSVKKYLGLNIDDDLKEMWENVRESLRKSEQARVRELSTGTKSSIKGAIRIYSSIEAIGREHGYPVQVESVKQSISLFNELSKEDKREFISFLFGLKDPRRILNLVATGDMVDIHWNAVHKALLSINRGQTLSPPAPDENYSGSKQV